jgi:hypothetical protein
LPQLESLKLYAKGKEKSKLSILSQKGWLYSSLTEGLLNTGQVLFKWHSRLN